ncbi:MAG TPA: hypothetical protein VHI13_08555 [Candidatus Kapabacteria bacterium]|nr:hypothetical protein [Candidatus Kapabacteria bacterium]
MLQSDNPAFPAALPVPTFPMVGTSDANLICLVHVAFLGPTEKVVTFTLVGRSAPWITVNSGDGPFWSRIFQPKDGLSLIGVPDVANCAWWSPLGACAGSIYSAFTYGYSLNTGIDQDAVLITIIVQPGIIAPIPL